MILIGVRFDATLAMQVRLTSNQINTGQGAASKSWVETRTVLGGNAHDCCSGFYPWGAFGSASGVW